MSNLCFPNRLDLEITSKCKFKCGVCSVSATSSSSPNEISITALENKIQEFRNLGGKEVSITGGEPSERGHGFLVRLVSFCNDLNLKVRMYTVGYGFQNFRNVLQLAKSGLNTVLISLEGSREIDEEYKGVKGSYDIAKKAIGLFKKAGVETVIHFTPTKMNYKYLPHVVELAERYEVKQIRIMSFVPQGRGWDNKYKYLMDEHDIILFNQILRKLSVTNSEIRLKFSGDFSPKINMANRIEKCTLRMDRFVITSNGIMIPSLALRMQNNDGLPDTRFNLGRIGEKTIMDAWTSKIMQTARRSDTGCGTCPGCCS